MSNPAYSPDFSPFVTPEKYAEMMGVELRAVTTLMDNHSIPVYQPVVRGNRYVNLLGLIKLAEEVYEHQKPTALWGIHTGIRSNAS
ncbi:hypothetical protein HWQ46_08895 [Shewanella sp. D64]|uniref:hypothetical protein n=1 Tax=unclassified Shewanella TaxID=196818 RepID=UPI0022BA2A7A|nr:MULTISPECIES: hypothetical protein [unclassified Shewanella]MEC4725656.1 hypothetical protein [Shewanella sp. D64]MEC4737737.1 hypothetical protein [Shewanella sp. E94]WBJ93540.1 hypothetical protein HWQ47_16590 [Shewanella sp. MTB7]